ncbi:MAG: site-specific recombinase [Methanolobus sp. T82-4]|jgi:integrase/recombinase XerD|uniref:tyrosine-type recombinase/integrase n=1 Tax=Methanolobus zinderi TaxID=536044 RepID=UPI0007950F67|nr:MAG: site-specific recombinase [Methanolobus sp. T82-4]
MKEFILPIKLLEHQTLVLFLAKTGNRITRSPIYRIVTDYTEKFGIHNPKGHLHEKFTPHCLWVWFTTWLRRSGMSKDFIKELRGATRGEAMDIYDQISPDELKVAYMKHMPVLRIGPQ